MLCRILTLLPLLMPPPNGEELVLAPLASPASTRSAFPNLQHGADGQVYLSWVEREAEGLAVMRLSVLGEDNWSAPVEVVRGTDLFLNWADFPSICSLASGVLIAHWLRQASDSHAYSAEFALSSDAGRTWSTPRVLHDDRSATEHGFVSIVAMDAETFGAVWLDGRSSVQADHEQGATRLYFRTIRATGELGKEVLLDERVCDCCPTSLVAGGDGELFATYRDRSASEVRDIALVRYDGERWSGPGRVHDDGWMIDGCPVNGPRVASRQSAFAVAWFTGVGGGGGSVRLAFRNQAGEEDSLPIDIDHGRPVGRVDLVLPTANSALVSWLEYAGEGKATWLLRRVARDGKKGDSVKVVEVLADRSSGHLRMVTTDERVIVAWTGPGSEGQVETAQLLLGK